MRNLVSIALLLCCSWLWAQTALYHQGGMQLHENGAIGFHSDFIDDGNFTTTTGLIGFYGNQETWVSGTTEPTFFDVEFANLSGVLLQTTVNVGNNVNFISGNVLTARDSETASLNFLPNAFFVGEGNGNKVDGFARANQVNTFMFPIGNQNTLRALTMNSGGTINTASCAYFSEDPGSPIRYSEAFDTEQKNRDIGGVSTAEFWVLDTDATVNVTLTWNINSNLVDIANELEDIVVVGWSKAANQWVILGAAARGGDLNAGLITSENFVPSDFGAITLGSTPIPTDTFAVNNPTLGNYFLSPNGDGVNDRLEILGTDESPNNVLNIFNRFGQKVFEMTNYTNEFDGVSNLDNFVIKRDIGLPEGIYYYTISLLDLELQYQGFFYLDR
ncbi:gliding motility-associated C-terminal domain-containing protein [uncultured Croceitalea sp.]|uniref:gliding motility-associated C-terminal domain-containing protein n=1 Tax=uncultured Croceitalea sp. TaxID=1798908 RepID=UPI00330616F3